MKLTSLRWTIRESCIMIFNSGMLITKGNHGRMGIVLAKIRRLIWERKCGVFKLVWSVIFNLATSKSTAFCRKRQQPAHQTNTETYFCFQDESCNCFAILYQVVAVLCNHFMKCDTHDVMHRSPGQHIRENTTACERILTMSNEPLHSLLSSTPNQTNLF